MWLRWKIGHFHVEFYKKNCDENVKSQLLQVRIWSSLMKNYFQMFKASIITAPGIPIISDTAVLNRLTGGA